MLEFRFAPIIPVLAIWSISSVWASPVILPRIGSHNSLTQGKNQAALDVRTTIEEVQKMLAQDPNLPRLTRGEIEELFEQVTKEEYQKSLMQGDLTRAKHMRALMLVLPYNTENSNENLQELYNRPPVTKVVSSAEAKPQKSQKTIVPSGKVEIHSMESIRPTTYKPAFRKKQVEAAPSPTTYRPHAEKVKTGAMPLVYVTTADTPPQFPENLQTAESMNTNIFSSHYSAKNSDFNKNSATDTKSTTKSEVTPDLEELLESLGFAAQSQSRKRFKLEELEAGEYPKPVISSLIKQDRISVDELTPEGLRADDFKKGLAPEVRPEDYVAFKPLPILKKAPKNIEPELENYLRMFGILEKEPARSGKSIHLNDPTISTTTTPLLTSSARPARIKRIDTTIEEGLTSPPPPVEQDNLDKEDYVQLQQLLSNIRKLQELNISLTDDTFKTLDLKYYNLSQTLLSQGPDPIETADSTDPAKNEIKRQSDISEPTKFSLELTLDSGNDTVLEDASTSSTTIDETSTTISPATTRSTTTTTTPESPRRAEMEDNFRGLDPVTEEPLPAPRKNGFYFLADWNSFLEVGDGPEQVVVRFNPQVGDPSRFIPITVP